MALSKSKSRKPTKVVKPRDTRWRSTESHRQHRFRSFAERISTLKIDPIRRRRDKEEQDEQTDVRASYFARSLAKWRERNLSKTFTSFASQASRLAHNLPLVLHHQDQIMASLIEAIDCRDALAMEPLMGLLADFAHDLDTHFERHFPLAVATVANVAAGHSDPAVVEWSFTCLAWLFKYLSRLLVPDLKPVFELMAPYLGRARHKHYIVRFAAESLSFLLRKAAISHGHPEYLSSIVKHILTTLDDEENARAEFYTQGIMTLFTDAMKGVQHELHSAGLPILKELLTQLRTQPSTSHAQLVVGILTSLIHYSTPETFQPVFELCFTQWDVSESLQDQELLAAHTDVLFAITSVRKSTRIHDWRPILDHIARCFQANIDSPALTSRNRLMIVSLLAVTIYSCSSVLQLQKTTFLDLAMNGPWMPFFLQLCDMTTRLDRSRFDQLLSTRFRKYVLDAARPEGMSDDILRLLPYLSTRVKLPVGCLEQMQQDIAVLADPKNDVRRAYLVLKALPHIEVDAATKRSIASLLYQLIDAAIGHEVQLSATSQQLILGHGMYLWLTYVDSDDDCKRLFSALCRAADRLRSLQQVWANILALVRRTLTKDMAAATDMGLFKTVLLRNLTVPSHEVRLASLEIIQELYRKVHDVEPVSIDTAVTVETTPISLDTARSISLNIRRLGAVYQESSSDPFLAKAIPSFCLGLMHLRFSQAWNDSIEALAQMARVTSGEETIMSVLQDWLLSCEAAVAVPDTHPLFDGSSSTAHISSEFECPNLVKLTAIRDQVFNNDRSGRLDPSTALYDEANVGPDIPMEARSQALKVLDSLSDIAEKRSRLLVPVLLDWAGPDTETSEQDSNMARWSRKDQKALLSIFAKFHNPRVLFKSADVRAALLKLCANGDVEIQKAALTALLSWKEVAVVRCQQNLWNLLDDAHFREELAVFLQGDDEDGIRASDVNEVMPILLRLLYGRLVGGTKDGQQIRRKATFVALSRFDDSVLQMFIDVSLHGIRDVDAVADGRFNDEAQGSLAMSSRQQVGLLNMLGDMLDTIGSRLAPFVKQLLNAIVLCTISASRQLLQRHAAEISDASLLRSIRQSGLMCIVKIYSSIQPFDHAAFSRVVRAELLEARLASFVSENSQGISAILRLIAVWSQNPDLAPFLWLNGASILSAVSELLQATVTRDEVRLFLLTDILEGLLQDSILRQVPEPVLAAFTGSISSLLSRQPEKSLLDGCVRSVSKLASSIRDASAADSILDLSANLLTQPAQAVSVRAKVHLLQTCIPLLQLEGASFHMELYRAMCGLFSRFFDRESRSVLAQAFKELCKLEAEYDLVRTICVNLNAAITSRLDEPDHAAQEGAFLQIYDRSNTFTSTQWLPIMHNCLYHIRDEEDMVNRSSAAKALQAMIAACSSAQDNAMIALVQEDLFFAIQRGMSHKSEFVRAEYLLLLEHIIIHNKGWQEVSDMTGLAVSAGDDDLTVFADILNIQQHRRLQALRKLGQSVTVSSENVSRIFLPLLDHFVFDQAPGDAGRTLADQTVQTIGQLAQRLRWTHQRKTLSRYYALLKSREDDDKVILRLIGAVIDGLVRVLHATAEKERALASENDGEPTDLPQDHHGQRLRLPENRASVVSNELLPPLLAFLHLKDESKVDRRVAVAISVVKLLKLLPEDEFIGKLAPALTDISHILRSRDFEAREQTRRSLSTILQLIGTEYLGFMLKELRGALQRGYQLHVLSYTVHHLLVNSASIMRVGEFDAFVDELCTIVLDDIFGTTGLEKDSEEYRSNVKEIKSSKSYDTLEILARTTSVKRLGRLLSPLQAMLYERLDSSMVKKVDNLLLRVQQGIDQNPDANSRDMLILCYELVRDGQLEKGVPSGEQRQLKYAQLKSSKTASSSSFGYKITAFAFATLRKVLRRHEDLQTTQNLTAFLPIIGDALIAGQEEAKIEAAKVLSIILHVRLPELDQTLTIYLKEAIKMVKDSKSTATESARAGLELATAVLRERRDAQIRETDVALLLRCIKADLDQPGQQGQMYRFLRAVLGRKIIVTEVYEVMDEIAKSMVNNPDEGIRQNARAAYVHFLVDFPQSKDRWARTVGFFIKNFAFEHASGRKSTLEAVHALLGKLSDTVAQDILLSLYVGLVPRLVSDPDRSCRDMAAALITQVLEKAETAQSERIKSLTTKWLRNDSKSAIHVGAMECWSLILRANKANVKETTDLIEIVTTTLVDGSLADNQGTRKKSVAALDLLLSLCEIEPQQVFSRDTKDLWQAVRRLLASPAMHIRERSLSVQRLLFNDTARTSFIDGQLPAKGQLTSAGGLQLDAQELRELCLAHLQCLRQLESTDTGSSELVARNLLFLGRIFAAGNREWPSSQIEDDSSEDEQAVDTATRDTSAFGYLFSRLAFILRRENAPVMARITALQIAGALLGHAPDTVRSAQLLTRPLYVLTDSSVPQREEAEYQALSDKAREMLEVMEQKVGAETYVRLLTDARRAVIGKREERRQKRKIEAVSQPEKWVRDKRKRHDIKKMKSKSRAQESRARRAIY